MCIRTKVNINLKLKMGNMIHLLYIENFKILTNGTRKKHEINGKTV